jgi:hypothetical protein
VETVGQRPVFLLERIRRRAQPSIRQARKLRFKLEFDRSISLANFGVPLG